MGYVGEGQGVTHPVDDVKRAVQSHYTPLVQDYTDEYSPSYQGYPANLKRLDIVLNRVQAMKAMTLLDCGCGEGTPMRRIYDLGTEVWGFDFVREMVSQADTHLKEAGLTGRVWQGDATEAACFRPTGMNTPDVYDVCIALGVFPHIEDELITLRNMAAVTRPGGRVPVEFRNELFALFTLNRYSYELFRDKLMPIGKAAAKSPRFRPQVDEFEQKLGAFFNLELPPIRTGSANAPGYDQILSKFHNPHEVGGIFEQAGLKVADIHFYHFHALPPMFERDYPDLFRTLSLEMEKDPSDWRGYFMASAFVVEAVKEAV